MRKITLAALAVTLAAAPAFGQHAPSASGPHAAKPAATTSPPPNPAVQASTPESRSATALALSHEPTFDEGTAQRIREAALSYGDIAVRGGWPTIPADAKFTLGVPGPHDDVDERRSRRRQGQRPA